MLTLIFNLLGEIHNKPLEDVATILKLNGCVFRVVSEDGEILEKTNKFVPSRINLHVVNNVVVDAEVG
jgi:hypothetical protein